MQMKRTDAGPTWALLVSKEKKRYSPKVNIDIL